MHISLYVKVEKLPMELTWGTNVVSTTDPWNFGCDESETLDLQKVWNQDIARILVDSLTDSESKSHLTITFQAVTRILKFSKASVLIDLDKYGLLGVLLGDYSYKDPKIVQHVLGIFADYTEHMESAVYEIVECDMVWVIYDMMDQVSHHQQWQLLTNGLTALTNIAETPMTSLLDQKWKMKHEIERPLYNILLPGLKKISTQEDNLESIVTMVIQLAACTTSLIIHDDAQNDDDKECIKNLGNILLMCGIIPNHQIWCNISHALPAILTSNNENDVCTSIKSKIMKPMCRDWHVSLKVEVIDGLNQWIIQQHQLNGRIVSEMMDTLVKFIKPVDEFVESMIRLLESIMLVDKASLTMDWVMKIAIECQSTSQIDQLYSILTSIIARYYLSQALVQG